MTEPRRLSGPERAALVVLGLDEGLACEVMRLLGEESLRKLLHCVDTMAEVPVEELDPAFEAFERELRAPIPRGVGAYVRKLTAAAIGTERAQRLMAPTAVSPRALEALKSARSATLAALLEEEHPQVAAVLVSQLPREQAAKVVLDMSPARQADLIGRLAGLEEIPAAAVETASEALAKALSGAIPAGERGAFDGVVFAAGLLNELKPDDSERLLGTLADAQAALAAKVREKMFTFEDLGRVTARGLQALMREVASETLLVALKTASEGLREQFLGAISSRAATQMREDLALMPPTRLSDVEKAQKEIVEGAMRLAQEGRLELPSRGGEKLV